MITDIVIYLSICLLVPNCSLICIECTVSCFITYHLVNVLSLYQRHHIKRLPVYLIMIITKLQNVFFLQCIKSRHCFHFKDRLNHLKSCNTDDCLDTHCIDSKKVFGHFKQSKNCNCPVCQGLDDKEKLQSGKYSVLDEYQNIIFFPDTY